MKPYASYKPSGVAWLGDVPAHWRIEKVKFQARLRGDKAVGANGVRYVGMEHVLPKVGKFNPVVEGTQEEAESTVNVFFKGDVLFGKLRPYLAKCVVADTDGVCSSEFLVLSPSDEVVPAYLNATMLMQEFIDAVDASTYGAKMPRADWGFIGQQRLPLPPPDEQQAIADYLDTETARIDTLVQEKEELVGLLREWRQSVIAEVVTKGLNKTVAMKPSGVLWLGDVPIHWQVMPLRYLSWGVKTGGTPVQEAFVEKQSEHTVPWYAPADLRDFFLTESSRIVAAEYRSSIDVFAPGTIALVGIGDVGRVAMLTVEGTGNQQLNFIRPVDGIFSNFLTYALMAGQEFVRSRANVTLIPILNQENTKRLRFAVPPPDEQQAIAEYLDDETAKIDALITHTQEEIALLKELRAATIADAVLGRVDVRTTVTKGVRRAENEL